MRLWGGEAWRPAAISAGVSPTATGAMPLLAVLLSREVVRGAALPITGSRTTSVAGPVRRLPAAECPREPAPVPISWQSSSSCRAQNSSFSRFSWASSSRRLARSVLVNGASLRIAATASELTTCCVSAATAATVCALGTGSLSVSGTAWALPLFPVFPLPATTLLPFARAAFFLRAATAALNASSLSRSSWPEPEDESKARFVSRAAPPGRYWS